VDHFRRAKEIMELKNRRLAGRLCSEDFPPGQHSLHQGPHAQFAGDGQGLVQQRQGLFSVTRLVPLEQGVGVVAAGPGQLRPVACLAAEQLGVLEAGSGLV